MSTAPAATQPLLISLAGVAELARVRRPVASMWRARFREADTPFPPASAHDGRRELFDADAVAQWLVVTGHGNNPDAVADAAAVAEPVGLDIARPDDLAELSALIALRAGTGEPLTTKRDALRERAHALDPDDTHLTREIDRHLQRGAPALDYVDRLVDARYSPAAALEHLQRRATRMRRAAASAGEPHHDLLTLTARLVAALADPEAPRLRVGPGVDAALLDAASDALGDDADVEWPGGAADRALRRGRLCRGLPADDPLPADGARTVMLARVPTAPGATVTQTLDEVDDVVLRLDADDVGVLIGPARVLVDALPATAADVRALTLRTGRVRAIVRLDAGLVPTAVREAQALWVFGPEASIALGDRVIALADLTGVALTPAAAADLVSDVVANLGGPAQATAHTFRFARLARTSSVLARDGALVADAAPRRRGEGVASRDLPALLDVALGAAAGDAPAVEVMPRADALPQPDSIRLDAAAAAGHVRVLPGTRLDADELGDTGLVVVSADDLDDPDRIGGRRVDHLAFAQRHPHAQLTRPDDIVFRTAPTPRAWVDTAGSHVVASPARVLRIDPHDSVGLVPELIAADIAGGAAGPGAWRRWMLRRVDPVQVAPLRAALHEAAATRADLHRRIDELDRLTGILCDAVAVRAVSVQVPESAPPRPGAGPPAAASDPHDRPDE
ncbi:hypothetical protein [Microbacterium luticocti]|uniref:hypothetical protein n=1 Tax=Microbacterium luticocti TaxID=451764 RepID=UPI0003FCB05D|nr:hypothetical protein [Microbacterium luticocti]